MRKSTGVFEAVPEKSRQRLGGIDSLGVSFPMKWCLDHPRKLLTYRGG